MEDQRSRKPKKQPSGNCLLCEQPRLFLTSHHLIPKELDGRGKGTVQICAPCHTYIHKVHTNEELKENYFSLDRLKNSEKVRPWIRTLQEARSVDIGTKMYRVENGVATVMIDMDEVSRLK
jgi:5-methylcytosine-specific restriction enzyme A